jgi:hypothetical protein
MPTLRHFFDVYLKLSKLAWTYVWSTFLSCIAAKIHKWNIIDEQNIIVNTEKIGSLFMYTNYLIKDSKFS